MHKIFIDGQAGTTGLQIVERLKGRQDITLLEIPHEERKNKELKRDFLNQSEVVILCLPDEAAVESVAMIENPEVKVLDASTAHRTDPNWVYGLPELRQGQREKIKSATRVSNPGCYPTGFLLAMTPLITAGIVTADYPVTVNAISGYSGGGRQMIEKYQEQEQNNPGKIWASRPYAMAGLHKHIPEMQFYSGLEYPPIFAPSVAHIEQGMLVSIPLVPRLLKKDATVQSILKTLKDAYESEPFIQVNGLNDSEKLEGGFLSPTVCNDTNQVDLFVFGQEQQIFVIARLDNLGKGASGAAVQNLNLMMGVEEKKGL